MLFQNRSCSNICFWVVGKCLWVKGLFGLIAMFFEVIPFGVKWPMRGSCVLKQVLKILCAYSWMTPQKRSSGAPFLCWAQRSALLHKWVLRSSRLKIYALSTEEIESCWCKRVLRACWSTVPLLARGIMLMLSVLAALSRLLLRFWG